MIVLPLGGVAQSEKGKGLRLQILMQYVLDRAFKGELYLLSQFENRRSDNMANKTEGVKILVQDVMRTTLREPYGEDVILDVFKAIKSNPDFTRRYTELSDDLRDWVVNNWIGKYTKDLVGMKSLRQVKAPGGYFISSYKKLGH
jgi:hypothetical protein